MIRKAFCSFFLALLLAPQVSNAIPGDVLFSEDFEDGTTSGWVKTVGDPMYPTFGVNTAFGDYDGFVAGEVEVRAESPTIDLSTVSGARVSITVTRGINTKVGGVTLSNRPEDDENFELEYLDDNGVWQTIVTHPGGNPAGEVFTDVVDLPANALHSAFKLRAGTWGGDGWDGDPDDFWHFDDISIIETSTASGDLSACTLGDDFEGGLGSWTGTGFANTSGLTYRSASNSAILSADSTMTSGVIDLAGKTATISAWVRAGGWPGGPDKPESGDRLEFQYLDMSGNWQTFYSFCNGCGNSSTKMDLDAGGVGLYSGSLPGGALHAGFQLRIESKSNLSAEFGDSWFVDDICIIATSPIDHFAIEHDGNAVNCQPELVTVKAHASDHSVAQNFSGSVSLATLTNHGDWSVAVGNGVLTNAGNGAAVYQFSAIDKGAVLLKLADTYVETNNINVNSGGVLEDFSEDPDLVFAETGFQFIDPATGNAPGTQIAGKPSDIAPSNAIALQAIRTSDETGACEAAFVGNTSVDLALSCETPTSCAGAAGVVNGNNIATGNAGAPASWTTLNLDFGDNTVDAAPIVFRYDESGGVKLHARKALSPSGAVMAGSSNTIVVRPFGFDISVDEGSVTAANPAASNATGSVFERAGNAFRVTARAVAWQESDDNNGDGIPDGHDDADASNNANLSDNAALTNFAVETSPDSVSLAAALVAPVGGNGPALTGTTTLSSFSSGASASNDIRWGEAGIIEISAAITDGDYLGGGSVHGRSGYVGRFTPAWLESTVISHGCNNTMNFTYSGQPLQSIRINARNAAGVTTQNYDGGLGFAKDVTITEVNGLTGSVMNGAIAAEDFSGGTATLTSATDGIGFTFANKETAPATARFRASDQDSISSSGHAEAQTQIRSARMAMTAVHSSLIADARSPITIETFNAGEWSHEEDDTCSVLDTSGFLLGAYSGSGDPQIDTSPSATFLSGGAGQFILTTPGGTDEGSRLVTYSAPDWLEYNWNGGGDEAPSATVTFFDLFNTENGMIDVHEVVP